MKKLISILLAAAMLMTASNFALPESAYAENEAEAQPSPTEFTEAETETQPVSTELVDAETEPEAVTQETVQPEHEIDEAGLPDIEFTEQPDESADEVDTVYGEHVLDGEVEYTDAVDGDVMLMAESYTYGELTYRINDDNTVTITDCDEAAVNIVIPESIEGFAVTSIGNGAFGNCSSLMSINLPDSLTDIDFRAFYGCNSLTSIDLPDGLTCISNQAFSGCKSLMNVELPDGLTSIGDQAFRDCISLSNVVIPNGVEQISDYAFSGCSSLSSINLPDSITSIDAGTFSNCSSLTGIILPECITRIDSAAFYRCSSLSNINLPDSLTSIGYAAFRYCNNLLSINLPDSLISIDGCAFDGSSKIERVYITDIKAYLNIDFDDASSNPMYYADELYLNNEPVTNIVVPDGVKKIPYYAFNGCSSLTNITLPDGVTSIGSRAFSGCSSLTSITLPDGVTSIDYGAFSVCTSLTSVTLPDGITAIGDCVFSGCSSLTSINLPDSLTNIGYQAFRDCINLIDIKLPDNISKIRYGTFYNCSSLKNVELPKDLMILEYNDKFSYGIFENCSNLSSISLSAGIQNIPRRTFDGCSNLSSIVLSDGITTIGSRAFSGCSSLTSINLPDSLTSIESYAFQDCSKIEKVYITDIKAYLSIDFHHGYSNPMYYADELYLNDEPVTNIVVPDGVESVPSYSFEGCSSLTSITLPDGVTSIGDLTFQNCSSLTSITLPDSLTNIGDAAFRDCSSLTSINLPDDLTSISQYAFYGCSSIININLPDNLTSIESYAFENCSSLSNLNLPDGLTSIDHTAFKNCSKLTNINLPDDLTGIEPYTFENCNSLSNLKLPSSLASIGHTAFRDCSSLTSITLPNSLKSIDDWAFNGCTNLKSVYYSGTESQWNEIQIGSRNTPLTNATIYFMGDNTASERNEARYEEIIFTAYENMRLPLLGDPLEGVTVTVNGATGVTDANGVVRLKSSDMTDTLTYDITATKDGYFDYHYVKELMVANSANNIYMSKKDPNSIYLKSLDAVCSDGNDYNILSNRKPSIAKTDTEQYTLTTEIDWNSHEPGRVYLRGTKSGTEFEFTDNTLTIVPSDVFDVGENVIFIAQTADGSIMNQIENVFKIEALSEEFSLVMPEVVSEDMGFIPFMEQINFNIGFEKGIEKYAGDVKVKDGKLIIDFSKTETVKNEDEFKILNKASIGIGPYGKFEIPISDTSDGEWSGVIGFKTKTSNAADDTIGYAMLPLLNYDYNTVVVVGTMPIPVTASVDFFVGAQAELGVGGTLNDPYFTGKVEASPGVEVFGGLGQDYDTVEVKAGLYGDLTGKIPVTYNGSEGFDLDPSITGSIGAKASVKVWIVDLKGEFEAGKFSWSRDGFKATWLGDEVLLFSADGDWELSGREYLSNGGGFVGDVQSVELFDMDVTNKSEQVIYENIFHNAEAVLEKIDGRNCILFTSDDTARDQQNGLTLMYSVQNDDGTWSAPAAVADDGTMDSTLSSSGRFVAWEDTRSELSGDISDITDVLSQNEISAAYFDGSNWISERLTDDQVFDFSPVVYDNGGTAITAWLSNTENDFTAQTGTTNINYSVYDGSGWSEPTVIENVGEVTRLTTDGENIIYKKGGSLYSVAVSEGTATELGYSGIGQYTVDRFNGKTVLAYFNGNNDLIFVDDLLGSPSSTTVTSDANVNSIPVIASNENDIYIGWTDHSNGYDNFCGARYSNGEWSDKITFVDGDSNITAPSLSVNSDGSFTASYMKSGKYEVQEDGGYTNGTTNLCVSNITPSYDLAIDADSIEYNDWVYKNVGVMDAEITVKNEGEELISGFDIEIYEKDVLIETISQDETVKAGASANVYISYTPEDNSVRHDITIKAVPKNVTDFDESNNSALFTLGKLDVTVSEAYMTEEGGRQYLNAVVYNNGSVDIPKVELQVHKDSSEGEIVYSEEITELLNGEEVLIQTEVEYSDRGNYYISVKAENDEDEFNDFSIAVWDNTVPDYNFDVLEDSYNSENGQLELSVRTVNNTDSETDSVFVMAAYDADSGELLKLMPSEQALPQNENVVNMTFDCGGLPEGFVFKLFMWDSMENMIPLDSAFEKTIVR